MRDVFDLAKEEIGTWEWAEGHNPKVLAYFKDAGHSEIKDDETAWCAAFVGAMLRRSGYKSTGSLLARSYLKWGEEVKEGDYQAGDIAIFKRGNSSWQGHVGFISAVMGDNLMILGGNQSNQVNEKPYPKSKLLGVRRMKHDTPRTSKAQSSTLQATAATGVAGATAVGTAVGKLDGNAQFLLIGCAVVMALGLAWIARRRIKRWAEGDR